MNAVEIEEAISALAERPFDSDEFPYAFLEAFGNKETTLKRLRKGESNKSDLGGVLQTNNIHIATCKAGEVTRTLAALKASPATARAKARFVLATDGDLFEAEDLTTEFRALDELEKNPALRGPRMGAELGRKLGVSAATGRRLHAKLTAQDRPGQSRGERSGDQSDERSGERS